MHVVFHYQADPTLASTLAGLATQGLDVAVCPPADPVPFMAAMREAEVLWHALEPATAEVIAGAPKLRLIQKIGVGLNTIDLEAARARGIAVCNMPGTNSRAVAEMTLALMLACLRRLPRVDRAMRLGQGWAIPAVEQELYGEIAGRTVGLVGYGAIPRMLTPVLRAMDARVLYTCRSPKEGADAERVELDELLAESDIVSLHVPLVAETTRLIDARALGLMRPGAILVNTARGGLVDEPALVAALASGRLRGAGLDVFAAEPMPATHPLYALDNVVLAPHVAWLTPETLDRSIVVAVENCRRLVAGEPLLNRAV